MQLLGLFPNNSSHLLIDMPVVVGDLVVSVLALGSKVRGFKPDRGRWSYNGDKSPQHAFLRGGIKAVGSMS
jgi:hypothetical protein